VLGHVLGQVLDRPVRLTITGWIDLRRFLARQHQQPGLDLGVVLAWRRALGPILEAVQTALGEAVAPQEDGAFGQTHGVGDRHVGLAGGHPQDDLGPIGGLLSRSTGGQDALQFSALGGR
jgi:hypothetical protein